jgi:hypothetical protein
MWQFRNNPFVYEDIKYERQRWRTKNVMKIKGQKGHLSLYFIIYIIYFFITLDIEEILFLPFSLTGGTRRNNRRTIRRNRKI